MKMIHRNGQRYLFFLMTIMMNAWPITTRADVPTWKIILNESALTFSATQNNAPVTGKFNKFSGDIHVDPNQLEASDVRIVVDVGSVTTSYSDLTSTLLTPDWFNVAVFPQAVFTTKKITKIGDKSYQANGILTIRDKTFPVTLQLTQTMYSPSKAIVKGSTILKRNQFGVGQGEWASTNEVKDDVQVNFLLTVERGL
jgi:polyisoprenoid-binding protein YceI